MRHTFWLPLLATALSATPLDGQATVAGVVVEAGSSRPVADVLVVLDTTRQVTTEDGRFRFVNVLAGSRTLRVSHIAYAQRHDTFIAGNGDLIELQIPIAVEAIRLDPLMVDVRSRRLTDAGFYKRAARGVGIHIPRADLEKSKSTRLADYLARVPGVRRNLVDGDNSRIDMRGGKSISMRCDTQFFLDGAAMAADPAILDSLSPQNIEGIEIYRGASETPSEFDMGRTSCGAIVIWTRHY